MCELQMVHEESLSDSLPMSPALPLTPGLRKKPKAERGKMQKGMSIVDHDVDLEDDNGIRKSVQMDIP